MRMWCVDPRILCRKHLLGEHVECHMFVGAIKRGISLAGYVRNKCVDTTKIQERHDELAAEIERRGYKHQSSLEYNDKLGLVAIDIEENYKELSNRCSDCAERLNYFLDKKV